MHQKQSKLHNYPLQTLISMIIFILLFGLAIGSHLNVIIARFQNDNLIGNKRSVCPKCNHTIAWYDLIPVFSFLILRGKCRNCSEGISFRYPFVELLNAVLYVFVCFSAQNLVDVGFLCILASILVCISFIDLDHMIIPDKMVGIIFVLGAVRLLWLRPIPITSGLLGAALGFGFLALIAIFTGAMGGGDVKLMGAAGLWLGNSATVLALMIGFVLGSSVGVLLIALKKKSRKDYIPFGPYLCIGIFVSLLYGPALIHWYMNLY